MEPLTAFSLVAGVLQVLDISFKAADACLEIYKDGSLATHRLSEDIAEALAQATGNLHTSQLQSSLSPFKEKSQILDLSRKSSKTATDLQREISKLKIDNASLRQALTKAVRSMRKRHTLKELRNKLEQYESTLDTLILIKLDAQALKDSHDIDSLDQRIQDLALRIERGSNTTAQLLAHHSCEIRHYFDQRFDDQDRKREMDQARERLMASLFFPDIACREDQIVDAFEETCQWIYDPPINEEKGIPKWHNFRAWLEVGKAAYWISGKPGAGKSTLMKYVVREPRTVRYLSEWKKRTEPVVVAFFFWNLGTELQKSVTGLLRSLIWQILVSLPAMINLILGNQDQLRGQFDSSVSSTMLSTWTEKRLLQMLEDLVMKKPSTVTLCAFVDGLDECVGDEDLLFRVIQLLSSAPGCKCRVQDLNEKDITRIVIKNLKPILEKNKPTENEAIDRLVIHLIRKAEGVFLWLSLMIKDLTKGSRNGDSIHELHQRLERTPNTIYGLYRSILQELEPLYRDSAYRTFKILIAANPIPLPVSLLGMACTEDIPWKHIMELDLAYFNSPSFALICQELCIRIQVRCGNLIDIKDQDHPLEEISIFRRPRTIEFIHRTVAEFLEEEDPRTFSGDSWFSDVGVLLAQAQIGLLFLFPFTRPTYGTDQCATSTSRHGLGPVGKLVLGTDSDENTQFGKLLVSSLSGHVSNAATAMTFIECYSSSTTIDKPIRSLQAGLTAQFLQALQYVTTFNDQVQGNLVKLLELGHLRRELFALDKDDNRMKCAALWGCRSYIGAHLPTEASNEQLEDLFRNAVIGLGGQSESRPRSSLLVFELLLQIKGFSLDKRTSWISCLQCGWRASLLGAFISQICRSCMLWRFGFKDDECISERQTCCVDVIRQFLSLGANIDTRINQIIAFGFSPGSEWLCKSDRVVTFYVDESPLACTQKHPVAPLKGGLSKIEVFLQSSGATSRRRFRFCNKDHPDMPVCAMIFDDEPVAAFKDIISANNQVDRAVMLKEWSMGGGDWLSDEEIQQRMRTESGSDNSTDRGSGDAL
ncbi:MAG: hypothetical protein Q9219_006588 [cf. Caloplaca sp. 3 TL-2023]